MEAPGQLPSLPTPYRVLYAVAYSAIFECDGQEHTQITVCTEGDSDVFLLRIYAR